MISTYRAFKHLSDFVFLTSHVDDPITLWIRYLINDLIYVSHLTAVFVLLNLLLYLISGIFWIILIFTAK